jgi:hypothetical protein
MSLQLGAVAPGFSARMTQGEIRFREWLTLTCPQTTGRNFDEILRVIDSLQHHRCALCIDTGELARG